MDYDSLPMILTPKDVQIILGWQKDQVYSLFRSKKFPSERIGCKYIIPRGRFFTWLGESALAPSLINEGQVISCPAKVQAALPIPQKK